MKTCFYRLFSQKTKKTTEEDCVQEVSGSRFDIVVAMTVMRTSIAVILMFVVACVSQVLFLDFKMTALEKSIASSPPLKKS